VSVNIPTSGGLSSRFNVVETRLDEIEIAVRRNTTTRRFATMGDSLDSSGLSVTGVGNYYHLH